MHIKIGKPEKYLQQKKLVLYCFQFCLQLFIYKYEFYLDLRCIISFYSTLAYNRLVIAMKTVLYSSYYSRISYKVCHTVMGVIIVCYMTLLRLKQTEEIIDIRRLVRPTKCQYYGII